MDKHYKNLAVVSLLPALGLLFGHIFMWSNNAHMFTNKALLVSFLVIAGGALVLFLGACFILPRILRLLPEKAATCMFYLCIAGVFVFVTWVMIDYTNIPYKNKIYAPLLTLAVFALLYFNKAKILAVFLGLMLCFSSFNFVKNNSFTEEDVINAIVNADVIEKLSAVQFKKKPNIYLYWLESYHDFEMLEKVYGINTADYQAYLDDRNFIVQKNTFSSGSRTLESFAQLYSCGKTDITNPRSIIGGDKNNLVFRTLKNNGYRVTLLTTSGGYYYLHKQGEYLDEVDFDVASVKEFIRPILSVNYFVDGIHKGGTPKEGEEYSSIYKGYLRERVKLAISRSKEAGQPYFIAFKGGIEHTPPEHVWTEDRKKWISNHGKGSYIYSAEVANTVSQELIDYILDNDPGALIILLGDHGAWSYRAENNSMILNYSDYGLNVSDLFDDYYRVLFAYRLPYGAQDDISHGMYMNNINVFMHIFAYLAEDPSVLELRTRSISRIGEVEMIDGKITDEAGAVIE